MRAFIPLFALMAATLAGCRAPHLVESPAAAFAGRGAGPTACRSSDGVTVDYVPAISGQYIGSPSIAVLPRGDYIVSHDYFGPRSGEQVQGRTAIFRSRDEGATWRRISEIHGAYWSSLFVHRNALYLLGTDKLYGHIVIRRSVDGGEHWTNPVDRTSGLLRDDGEYHCAPTPVVEHAGRLWRAFEQRSPPMGWGANFRAGICSIDASADLLDARQWVFSKFLRSHRAWNGGDMVGWLEGNAVVNPAGNIVDILRVETKSLDEKVAMVTVGPDARTLSFGPDSGFVSFPGGSKKFTIRFDPQTRLYWSIADIIPVGTKAESAGSVRNVLGLVASPDLRKWETRTVLLYHPDATTHGFQYVDWLFDGESIIAVCRTAADDGQGGAHSFHDANYLTFHRWREFRHLTMADSPAAFLRSHHGSNPLSRAAFGAHRDPRAGISNRRAVPLPPFN